MAYDNSNSGVLFKNDQGDNPNRPQYKGNAEVNGVEYWVSSWVKESKRTGEKFLSLAFEVKEVQSAAAPTADVPIDDVLAPTGAGPQADDDIPF